MRLLIVPLLILAAVLAPVPLWAGGSGLNVIVVVNQNSTNSVQLGNDYCQQRGVPPQNVLRMTGWTDGAVAWSRSDFETRLRNPLLTMLANRGLTNQVAYVLLSMDIPYRIDDTGGQNSTTSVLFYGFKNDTAPPYGCEPGSCSLPDASSNSFAFSELPFSEAPPNTASTNSFLAMMLTDDTLAGAKSILARGVASDSAFPTQAVYLAKTGDRDRNVRFVEFDNAIFASRVQGNNSLVWTNTDSTSFANLLGLMTGLATLSLPANAFVPGAMGDSLTSCAGMLFDGCGQTTLLAFLHAGAAGSYGTITEPCNYIQKFPDPRDYFYQNRGFCLAEAYYQSVPNPYLGLLVGEPLSAPFARPGSADWSSLTNGTLLSGQAGISLTCSAATTNLPLDRVDLFVDGNFTRTVTNLPPSASNILSVTLNGFVVNYTVPANATVASVTTGLATALNAQSNSTRIQVYAVGDRLDLQSLDVAVPGSNVTLSASTAPGAAAQLTTLLTPARPTFLDTTATGRLSILPGNAPIVGDWLQLDFTKTNGTRVTVSVTNTLPGTDIVTLSQALVNLVNANPGLQATDGVLASDLYDNGDCGVPDTSFLLYARTPGWPASGIQVAFTASTNLRARPLGTNRLQDNLTDLRPRNHLYVSSGAASLPASFVLDTTRLPDGFHQLTAVAYEGTSVRTQTHVSRSVLIQNTALTATLTPQFVGTNATLDMPLQFAVTPNATNISRIELFSTGDSVGVTSNQPTAVFTVLSATLGLGVHPFYALVTDIAGNQYQTQTYWVALTLPQPPAITTPPAAQSVVVGFNATFTVTATGTAPLTYQWLFDGTAIPSATDSNYNLFNVQLGDAGSYSVQVTNAVGSTLSATANLTVIQPQAPFQMLHSTLQDGVFRLSVLTEPGWGYFLEYSDTIPATNWISLSAVAGDGSIKTLSDPTATNHSRYYRVRSTPL
jgi:uncharacterized protein (TIGR03790 family)